MAIRDPNTHDLLERKICIADDVMVWPVHERGELVYRLEIPKLHRFFRVGYEEYVLISLLDGETTIPQACGLAASKLGRQAPSASQAGSIARWLLKNDLAHFVDEAPPSRNESKTTSEAFCQLKSPAAKVTRLIRKFNPFWIKLPLPQSGRRIGQIAKWLGPCFSIPAITSGLVLIVVSTIVLCAHWNEFVSSTQNIFDSTNWIWLLAIWVGLKLIHEFAHAAACHRAGGSVHESGLVLILFAPIAYVDVTSCWRMNSRWARIGVAAAGMYVELVIAAIALIAWTWTDSPQTKFLLHSLVLSAGLSTLMFNANALMRFDGYFILADLLEIPNLYQESSNAVRRTCSRWLTGELSPPSHFIGWRKHFISVYGFAAVFWRISVCLSLAIAASTMFAGAGILISLLGIALWLSGPLKQLSLSSQALLRRDSTRFARATVLSLVFTALIYAGAYHMPLPTAVTVPAVARYLPETTVRSRAGGFISKIHVEDGDIVDEGTILLELENRALTVELEQLNIVHQQNEIRLRQASDRHDESLKQILSENQKAVIEQLGQLQEQVDGLQVLAPRRGRVIAHFLDSLLGQHIAEGDEILIVASEKDKELIGIVDQSYVEEVRSHEGAGVSVRNASLRTIRGNLTQIEPRATDRLPDVSLASTHGGTLAVTTVNGANEEIRLLQPHFRVRIELDEAIAKQVSAGMRMQASFGYSGETFAQRVQKTVRRLWHAANQQH